MITQSNLSMVLADAGQLCVLLGFGLVAVGALAWAATVWNEINPLRHQLEEAEANIEVVMQKRIRLTGQLIQIAMRYADHEALIHLRVSADRLGSGRAMGAYYQQSGQAIAYVANLTTNFPALKADQTYMRLMDELKAIETELQGRYESYNQRATEYNSKRTHFPNGLLAHMFFKKARPLDPSLWHPR